MQNSLTRWNVTFEIIGLLIINSLVDRDTGGLRNSRDYSWRAVFGVTWISTGRLCVDIASAGDEGCDVDVSGEFEAPSSWSCACVGDSSISAVAPLEAGIAATSTGLGERTDSDVVDGEKLASCSK